MRLFETEVKATKVCGPVFSTGVNEWWRYISSLQVPSPPPAPALPTPGASYAQAIDTIGDVEMEEEWLCNGIEGREA